MPMVDLTKAYISQAVYLVGHQPDKRVRYRQEEAEQAFRSLFSTQSQQTNVPDEVDPSAPRLLFQAPHKQLLLSQVSVQLTLGFESASKDLAHQLEIIARNVRDVQNRIEQYKPKNELKEGALVFSINFPTPLSRDAMADYIHRRFFQIDPIASVASASYKAGYLTPDEFFLNIEVDVYEMRRAEINQPQIGMQTINFLDMPIVEQGYGVKIDINNKPQLSRADYCNPGPEPFLSKTSAFVSEKLNTFMGFLD